MQVRQVRLGQRPVRAELRQDLAAAGQQRTEPLLLTAEHLPDEFGAGLLPELRQRVLD